MRWLALVLLVGCAHGRASSGGSAVRSLTASLQARPGKWCSSVYVTREGKVLQGERGGCRVELGFAVLPSGEQAVRLPAPDERSLAFTGTIRASALVRRWVGIAAPATRSKPWEVRLVDDPVGLGLTEAEALSFDLRPHRLLAVEITDTDRFTRSPMPFLYGVDDPAGAWRADPRYCVDELASNVHLYPASGGDVARRAWLERDELRPVAVACSHTHANVFVLDLGDRDEEAFDVQVTFGNRIPLQFRLAFHRDDNVVGLEVVVPPAEL